MKNILFILILLTLSGCSIIGNIDEISTLQGYSKEKDGQHRDVKIINDHYDALSRATADGQISSYKDEASFARVFGDPVLKKEFPNGQERWLYRYAIYRMAKDEVNVYFSSNGQLIKWEKASCPKFF